MVICLLYIRKNAKHALYPYRLNRFSDPINCLQRSGFLLLILIIAKVHYLGQLKTLFRTRASQLGVYNNTASTQHMRTSTQRTHENNT